MEDEICKFVVQNIGVFWCSKITTAQTPSANGVANSVYELANARLSLGRVECAMKILAGDYVSRSLGPRLWDFDRILLEDDCAPRIGDEGLPPFPFHCVIDGESGGCVVPLER